MNAAEIREKFLSFFASKGHNVVASSPLVPGNDPTLLFTNSGMVQFKDVFTGKEHKPYKRAASAQRCVRAGGKHNDLENVGYTARHHTFFEMLGNFSFGDYFKQDAILYAWELLTQVYGLPAEKLYVTVYQEDDEAYTIWHQTVGVPAERIIRIGDNKGARYASDNFWQMADTGPCGPCSEIFYDHGSSVWGGPPGSAEEDGDRFIEIWNLVFMQFERTADGVLHPLPKPCVDTGMGLERIAAVLQHVHSNYEIDLFQALIDAAHQEVSLQTLGVDAKNNSLKVIADHIRACTFLMVDGVVPSNEGRGYVLRRIIRRAIRHGYKLGCRKPFFGALVPALLGQMGSAYPELIAAARTVQQLLQTEEERFFETLEHGMDILNQAIEVLPNGAALPGELAFKLHDTYGFPLDLTADVCREHNMAVDEAAFDVAMNQQRLKARAAGKFKADVALNYSGPDTVFVGYEALVMNHKQTQSKVLALYVDGQPVPQAMPGQHAVVVLDNTPFYAESGGQTGDVGVLIDVGSGHAVADIVFQVEDTQKISPRVWGHHGIATKPIAVGQLVFAQVETDTRRATMRNHSATHLLHKALQLVLGSHVAQKGSLVDEHKARFDFAHHSPVSTQQLLDIERWVNAQIVSNTATQARVMPLEDAKQVGATMLFGEQYGDEVRVLSIGDSCELCGGTHVERTGDIGFFKIMNETGVAAGVRRIEAATGLNAWQQVVLMQEHLQHMANTLRVPITELPAKIEQTAEAFKQAERELEQLKSKLAVHQSEALLANVVMVGDVNVLAVEVPNSDTKQLREMADKLRAQLKVCVLLLATQADGKVAFITAVSKPLCDRLKAGDLAKMVAKQLGGSGGGKPDMAQGGGNLAEQLPTALLSTRAWVSEMI